MTLERAFEKKMQACAVDVSSNDIDPFVVFNPVREKGRKPRCVIKPKDVPQLQAVVRAAGEEGVGLVPVSSGRPHIKGGTACEFEHAVVDLNPWKEIPWIDRRNRVCIIQPGVTYGTLIQSLAESGMTLPMPIAPRSTKSVLASVSDREPSTWPKVQWDMQDPVASTEFVYGTGDLFRSGSAGSPETLEEQRSSKDAQKMPMGPGQSDFQRVVMGSQGSMGIVTWISLRTELAATIEQPMLIGSDRLAEMIPYVYEVQRAWLGENSFILNRNAAAMLAAHTPGKSLDGVAASLPEYICLQHIAGFERLPGERVQYQLDEIRNIAGSNGLDLVDKIGEIDAAGLLKIATTPCGSVDWRHSAQGHCLSVFFLSFLEKAESYISIARKAAGRVGIKGDQVGVYLQPILQNHSCHVELMIPFDPENESEVKVMQTLEASLTDSLLEAGAFFSRPYGAAVDKVFQKNPGNTRLIRIAKQIFDPDNILNPGRFPCR